MADAGQLSQRDITLAADMPPRLLVVGPSWVGDMVMAQSLYKVLRQRHPDCAIDVLAPDWSRPVLQRMVEVDQTIAMPVGHGKLGLAQRWRLGRELSQRGYQRAYVLPNSLKSAFVPVFAGIPRRVGWRGEWRYGWLNDCRLLNPDALPLMVQRFAALGWPATEYDGSYPLPQLQCDAANLERLLDQHKLQLQQPVLALCPGAEFGPAKQWPERHYSALAGHYLAQGWQVWLFGSAKDQAVAQRIVAALTPDQRAGATNLAGVTGLGDAIDLLAQARAVVSNDSGLMHVAAALQRPLVGVYGSTSAAFTPPLGQAVRVVSLQLDCQPCFKRECPLQHLNCLQQLAPERVQAALDEVLAL